ncbi:dihydroneopterin aldolase family protein [Methanococcus aeolicus]|uniref:dihydroneopterin aldolase family protein n=1 Tax=Methanococcus aeolicus TaxID=42879 RepID=UPI0021C8C83E|nr:dihydroneopterin aldolase family protein [Methanococcus aeolicus]UXM84239.1 dihydroneopterin aldolase family protein [Methanococcus aeolicus]
MKLEENQIFNNYFKNLSDRERAVFEGGITMGALFHQFVGAPISSKNKEIMEKSIEESMKNQPCVEDIWVEILGAPENDKYISLSGEMLNVKLKIKINNTLAVLKLKYIKELDYPLMYVEEIL